MYDPIRTTKDRLVYKLPAPISSFLVQLEEVSVGMSHTILSLKREDRRFQRPLRLNLTDVPFVIEIHLI